MVAPPVQLCATLLAQIAGLTLEVRNLAERLDDYLDSRPAGEVAKYIYLCGCTTRARKAHEGVGHVLKYGPRSPCTELEHVGPNGVVGIIVNAFDPKCQWYTKTTTSRFHDPACEDPNRRGEIVAWTGDRS